MAPLRIATGHRNHATVLTVSGEIDLSNAGVFYQALAAALTGGEATVVVNMTGVTFMDSAGLHALLHARHDAASTGGANIAVVPSDAVGRLLHLSETDRMITVCVDCDAAIAHAADSHARSALRNPNP
jgi:anti-sigma B factor antagonist